MGRFKHLNRARRKHRRSPESGHGTPELGLAPASAPQSPPRRRRNLRQQRRRAKKTRQVTVLYGVVAVLFAALVGLLLSAVGSLQWGLTLAMTVLVLAFSLKYPRQALVGFIAFVPFSGTVVYALGGNSMLHLAKDLLYLPALLGIVILALGRRQPIVIPRSIKMPLAVLVLICLLTLILVNGSQQLEAGTEEFPLLIGLLGLKVLLGYLPLMTCVAYLLQSRDDLYRLMRLQVALIWVCCSLGFLQYLMLNIGLCQGTVGTGEALFKASLDARCLVGGSLLYSPEQGQIRLPGTSSAPWQWGWFLISGGFFAFGTAFCDRNPLWKTLGLLSLAAVAVMAVLSGQRIALALVPVTLGLLLLLTGQLFNLKRFLPVGLGLTVLLGLFVVNHPETIHTQWNSFQNRWQAAPPQVFILQQFQWAQAQQEGLWGQGVGRATNAARVFGQTELVETYHPKLLYEIGPLGLGATLVLYLTLTVTTFRAYRSIQDPHLRVYGASLWGFVLFISIFPYYYPLDVDPVNVYYWLAAGIVLKLPHLEKSEGA